MLARLRFVAKAKSCEPTVTLAYCRWRPAQCHVIDYTAVESRKGRKKYVGVVKLLSTVLLWHEYIDSQSLFTLSMSSNYYCMPQGCTAIRFDCKNR